MRAANRSITQSTDHAVRDWATTCPRVRSDLRFHYQDDEGEPVYVVEDMVGRRYHQLGLPEYRFLRALDGSRTVAQLIAQSASESSRLAIGEHETMAFLRWLLDQGLLESGDTGQSGRRSELAEEKKSKQSKKFLMKLLFVKIPLGNPDTFMSWANRLFGFTFSLPAMLIWLGVVGFGFFTAIQNRQQLFDAGSVAILPANWLALILVYAGLKIIHEIWHGIATKRFGGIVPEWGIQLIAWVTPLTYVDASSSWRFLSRRRRVLVSFAGIYIELFIAAIAIHVWLHADSEWIKALAVNIIFTASMVTLLFNANPLMRFDGYYILSDLSGIRNLAPKGQQLLKVLAKRFFLGIKSGPPPGIRSQFIPVFIYGLLAFGWRIIITVSIMAIVASFFRGTGMVIVGLLLSASVIAGVISFGKLLGKQKHRIPMIFLRLTIWAGLAAILLRFVTVNPAPSAVAVVQWDDTAEVRAECPGFVREILCQNNEPVREGQLLLRAVNPEEQSLLQKIELDLERSRQRARRFLAEGRTSARDAEQEVIKSLQDRLKAQEARVESLEIRAPIGGQLHAPDIKAIKGRFFHTGQHFFTIYPESPPRLVVSAKQNVAEYFKPGDTLRVRLRGRQAELRASIDKVEQRAQLNLPHPALASVNGGPLSVRNLGGDLPRDEGIADEISEAETVQMFGGRGLDPSSWQLELTAARVSAEASLVLPNPIDTPLAEGEWGKVRLLRGEEEPLGKWLWRHGVLYLRGQFGKAPGS